MYIKWEKPDLNQQVKHINLTLSLQATRPSVVYGQVHAHSTLPLKLLNCMHRDVMYEYLWSQYYVTKNTCYLNRYTDDDRMYRRNMSGKLKESRIVF